MFVSYLFIKTQARQELLAINKINAILNAFIVFCGWGLKDYLLKENFKSLATFPQKWNEALYSKLPLLLISLMAALLLPAEYSCIIFGFVILRTVNTLYDSLIIYNKKVSLFFLFDALAALLVVLLIWFRILNNHKTYFYILLGVEFLKLCLNLFLFRMIKPVYFDLKQAFGFLKSTKLFFLLAVISFFQSKADLYILGFLFEPASFNEYQVKISLISFVQVAIAAFVSVYSKLFFKDISSSETTFNGIVLKCGILFSILSAPIIFLIETQFFDFNVNVVNSVIMVLNIFIFSRVLIEMYYGTKLEKMSVVILMVFISGLLNIGLSFLVIDKWGITGALLSNTGSSIALYFLLLFKRKQGYKNLN